jgi:hypothetical protein
MSTNENVVKMKEWQAAQPDRLECVKCHATVEAKCNCGAGYKAVRAGAATDAAIADPANQEKSNRVLAEEIGVGEATVRRARKAGASNDAPKKRTGKNGVAQSTTKRKPGPSQTDKMNAAIAAVEPLVRAGVPLQIRGGLDVKTGLSHVTLEAAVAVVKEKMANEAKAQANTTDDVLVASAQFTKAQQEHLDAAKRRIERELKTGLAERLRGLDEEIRQRVLKEGKEYLAYLNEERIKARSAEEWYQKLINDHQAIFSPEEFKVILMALHPDNSASTETRAKAFRLVNAKKPQLTKER